MDKLDAMQIFVRVAEAGSFIAVAGHLNVARSAITRQISALEKDLGVKLMNRSTRQLSLTTAGSAYLEKCRVILNMVETAESGLAEKRGDLRGRIRMGLPISYGLRDLVPLLMQFAHRHPQIELSLDFSDRRSNLIEEGMDCTVRITGELEPGDIARKLGECRLLTLASPAYLSQHGKPKRPEELQHHECLAYASDMRTMSWGYHHKGQDISVPVRGRILANSGEALMQAAAKGFGITRQPDFIAAPFISDGRVVTLLDAYAPKPLGIYVLLPSNRFIPHRIGALIDFLSESIGQAKAGDAKPARRR